MRLHEKIDSPEFEVFVRNSAYLKKQLDVAKANLDEAKQKMEDNIPTFRAFIDKELYRGRIMLHVTAQTFKLFSISSVESVKYDNGRLYTYLRVAYSHNGEWNTNTETLVLSFRQVLNLRLFTDDLTSNDIPSYPSNIYSEL